MPNLRISIGKLKLKNPVVVASGAFGYAEEFRGLIDFKKLGAIVTKTITLNPRQGNPPARTCETAAGLLNSIGLENPGLEGFIQEKLPRLRKIGIPIIISIASEDDPEEFVTLAKRLDKIKELGAIELNISCPNIGHRSNHLSPKLIAQDPKAAYNLVKSVRKVTRKTIITKLSPNVTDIVEIAQAAASAGTDAISLVNTFYGMSIDIDTKRPKLGNIIGGLSGPAIKPLALKMVYDVAKNIDLPIIGMGGIMNAEDALEFIIAGASVISVGTANFINPRICIEIISGIKKYMLKNKIQDIKNLIGSLKA